MFEFFRSRSERHGRDCMDANYLVSVHGAHAMGIALHRATNTGRSARNLRHWGRVSRLVRQMLKRDSRAALQLA